MPSAGSVSQVAVQKHEGWNQHEHHPTQDSVDAEDKIAAFTVLHSKPEAVTHWTVRSADAVSPCLVCSRLPMVV